MTRIPYPTDYTPVLIRYAHKVLEKIYRSGYIYFETCYLDLDENKFRVHRNIYDLRSSLFRDIGI